jgi:hypothetical protein
VELKDVDVDLLVLDEENPRIGFWRDNIARISDDISQLDLESVLKTGNYEDYNRLKRSIESNEGAMQEIFVYPIADDSYKVIDGNTRVLIYRDLRDKYPNKEVYKKIRCKIFPKDLDDRKLDFIRLIAHLRGVNDWQAYERARMLYLLWQKGYTEEQLITSTKLPPADIKRWREAYRNMNEQFLPSYSHKSDALLKFSYFVEYEKVKDGMKRHGLTVKDFCDWVGNDEIIRAQDVRDLKKMLESNEISKVLADEGFQAAKFELSLSIPAYASRLFENIDRCIDGLKKMSREEEDGILRGGEPAKKEKIIELYAELTKFIELMNKMDG